MRCEPEGLNISDWNDDCKRPWRDVWLATLRDLMMRVMIGSMAAVTLSCSDAERSRLDCA